VALDGAGEALADRRALHVDLLAGGEQVTGTVAPGLYWPATSALTRNSFSSSPASTPALARCPASGLVTRDALRVPNATCRAL
jgi:hypothetical protein